MNISGKKIIIFGNGGSAANASHFVTDLGKGSSDAVGKRFRCMSFLLEQRPCRISTIATFWF